MKSEKTIYATHEEQMTIREEKNYALARETAREGFVLLRNDGALPLKNKKVALFGIGARKTIKGGTGSGSVNERYHVTIEDGLENAGYAITSKAWMDDYDQEYSEAYLAWKKYVSETTAGMPIHEVFATAAEAPFRYPAGRMITQTDIDIAETDTAIYVLARQAGEGHDRRNEAGDYLLTSTEYENISFLTSAYKHMVLIINVGGSIDLSFIKEIKGINAIVFYGQGGMEGGNALADVLSGKCNFNGKLTDTWAEKYSDYPCNDTYSYTNGNLDEENYTEGIYVGYRYFSTFNIRPVFPFGYGGSYTDFNISAEISSVDGTEVAVKAEVKNIGKQYAGKEVIQLYLSCPQGELAKEKIRLVTFNKTKDIVPGSSEEIELRFDMSQGVSYDERKSAWIVEGGDYILYVGNSSQNIKEIGILTVPETVVTEQCKPCCCPVQTIEEIEAPSVVTTSGINLPKFEIKAESFVQMVNDYVPIQMEESKEEAELLDSLTLAEMTELLRGGGVMEGGTHTIAGAGGKTSIALADKGIGNILAADGPAGLNILSKITIEEDGQEKPAVVPEQYKLGALEEMAEHMVGTGEKYYRYATAWPVHMSLAQTWNTELIERVGEAIGREMIEFGLTLWLAPGMNIHRNPLCGRNFEYFSEDPVISGKMAAALTRGVQSNEGVGTTLKHFAVNNQEDNRTQVSSEINERALREIYLKGFEIAVKDSNPMAIMTSYNKLNKVYTANSYDLLTRILRLEWGFKGLVMTDWSSCDPGRGDAGLCPVAGNDLLMPGTDSDTEGILKALEEGRVSEKEIREAAIRVLRVILNSNIKE